MTRSPDNTSEDEDDGDYDYHSSLPETVSSWLMISLPFSSLVFPLLLDVARSQPPNSSSQFAALTALLVSNRLYLYTMSSTIVALVALRSASQDSVALGQRVVDVTEELLYSPPLRGSGTVVPPPNNAEKAVATTNGDSATATKNEAGYTKSAMIQNLSTELGDSLDSVSSETQAIVLPVLVVALFASSFFFVQLLNTGDDILTGGESLTVLFFQKYAPILSSLWNGLILTLFTRCEVRRLLLSSRLGASSSNNITNAWLPWLVGAVITALAFGGVWQAQNFVNMALAILVARAIQINNLPAILGALSLLTLYDVTSVLFLPANAADLGFNIDDNSSSTLAAATTAWSSSSSHFVSASTLSSSTSSSILSGVDAGTMDDAKTSAMGAVAANKLTGNFQPGLLTTRLEGKFGGALGLGDAVFPSLLATMARRFDLAKPFQGVTSDTPDAISLFVASMVGYVAGCLACEVLPVLSSSGVPALLLITPFMVTSTLGAAALQGRLDDFWNFDPAAMDSK